MITAPLTVMVTGVGAPPGVSVMKALRQSQLTPRIVGVDADPDAVGLFRSDATAVLPHAGRDPSCYLDALCRTIEAERATLVCFGSEIEMMVVAPQRAAIEARTGAHLVVNDAALLARCMDKLETVELLRGIGVPVPATADGSDAEAVDRLVAEQGFPVIVKPRRGSGSRGLHVVRDRRQLEFVLAYQRGTVVQEWLPSDDSEYTIGAYRSPRLGYIGTIVFRRQLSAGVTYRATVEDDPEIDQLARTVCDGIGAWGPVNLQLRRTPEGPRIFEINLRFSSSAVMRAAFGYNEPELCIRDLVLQELVEAPAVRPGRAMRYWDELYLEPDEGAAPSAAHTSRGRLLPDF